MSPVRFQTPDLLVGHTTAHLILFLCPYSLSLHFLSCRYPSPPSKGRGELGVMGGKIKGKQFLNDMFVINRFCLADYIVIEKCK